MIHVTAIPPAPTRCLPALRLLATLAAPLLAPLSAGCGALELAAVEDVSQVEIRVDANSRVAIPGRRMKFFVDIVNRSGKTLDVGDLKVELRVSPQTDPDTVSLRQTWTYRESRDPGGQFPLILDGKKLTIPLLPERDSSEFPLEILTPGDYTVTAAVNERSVSRRRYPLAIARPDLAQRWEPAPDPRRRSTSSAPHRRFSQESTAQAGRRRI